MERVEIGERPGVWLRHEERYPKRMRIGRLRSSRPWIVENGFLRESPLASFSAPYKMRSLRRVGRASGEPHQHSENGGARPRLDPPYVKLPFS